MKEKIIKHIKSYSVIEIVLLIASVVFLVIDFVTHGGYFEYIKGFLVYLEGIFKYYDGIASLAWLIGIYGYIILHISIILLIISLLINKSRKRLTIIIINFLFCSTETVVTLIIVFLAMILEDTLSGGSVLKWSEYYP